MRVIAGKARSLRLKTIEGMDTRPTTDRIKETLFNMIQPFIADSRFLDLFAGSGGIGIEALSPRCFLLCICGTAEKGSGMYPGESGIYQTQRQRDSAGDRCGIGSAETERGRSVLLDFYGSAIWQRSGVSGAGSAAGNYVGR